MHLKKLFLNSLPLLLLGTVMVYAAAPSGGYLPGATTDPDCSVGDTGCFVTLPTDQDNQNLTLSGTNLSIEDGNSVTLPSFTDTNTQLTETQVDAFVVNNGYLTGEVDGSITNEIQNLTLSGSTLSISDGNDVTLPSFTDTNTQLTETEVDSFVANNGYLTGYTDTDDQTLTLSGSDLSIADGNSVSLSGISGSNIWTQTGSTTYYNEGNVGIGTNSPARVLHLEADSAILRITDKNNTASDNTAAAYIEFRGNDGQIGWFGDGSSGSNDMTVLAENEFRIATGGSGSPRLSVNTAGNVGIGTTTPTYKLEVSGANSDASINGVRVGKGGGDVSTNTAVGNGALNSNTTGIHNAANGYLVLNNNTTGHSNTAMGYTALRYNTTGFRNAAYGYAALASNTTGYYNTANGYQSLYFNTTGNTNTANGYQSLYSNTTGYQNAANGYRALHSNTTGIRNSAQGSFALDSNTTGSYNTSNGSFTLHLNTTGHSNTANGYQALYDNTTGNYNTAVGMYSLRHSTGSTNTAFGYQAGDNITEGSNNIIIGANTDAPSATASNQLNIGNWIYGDDGDIGIGTSTPLAALHVTTGAIAASSSNYPSFFVKNDGKTDGVLGKTWGMMNYGGGLYFNGYGSDSSNLAPGAPVNALFLEDQTGNVGIGTATPAQKLDVNGNIAVSGTTVHTSDGRLKTNIEDIDNALERILTIKGVSYNWKKQENNTPDRQIGVIAQDVEVEFPELVLENGEYKSVNYSGLVGPIIEAMRELWEMMTGNSKEIEELQTENQELKIQLDTLLERVEKLENTTSSSVTKN